MAPMAAEERIALIKENLAETLDFDMIEKIINDGKDPKVYWGTSVTHKRPLHIAIAGVQVPLWCWESGVAQISVLRAGLSADNEFLKIKEDKTC